MNIETPYGGAGPLVKTMQGRGMKEPRNEHVVYIANNGIRGSFEFKKDTEKDILVWAKNESNAYHGGSSCTIVEQCDETVIVDTAFEAYCKCPGEGKMQIVKNKCPTEGVHSYHEIFKGFVFERYSELFKQSVGFYHYLHCKRFHTKLKDRSIYEVWKSSMEEKANFIDSKLDNAVAMKVSYDFVPLLLENLADSVPKKILDCFILEGLKACVPTLIDAEDMNIDGIGCDLEIDWIFQEPRNNYKLKWLLFPVNLLIETKVKKIGTARAKQAAKAIEKEEKATARLKRKRRQRREKPLMPSPNLMHLRGQSANMSPANPLLLRWKRQMPRVKRRNHRKKSPD